MNVPSPDEFSEELLAAYADGELDGHVRSLVERWLEDHPEALEKLRAQCEFSAANTFLWQAVEPPEPSVASWARARREIDLKLNGTKRRPVERGRTPRVATWIAACLALGGVAAAIAWVSNASNMQPPTEESQEQVRQVCGPVNPPEVAPAPRPASPQADPLAEFAVLPMAADEDVVLDRVPNFAGGWLPVGEHPVPGIIDLAMVEDFILEDAKPSPAWPANHGSKMTNAPGDAPMIFAAKPW